LIFACDQVASQNKKAQRLKSLRSGFLFKDLINWLLMVDLLVYLIPSNDNLWWNANDHDLYFVFLCFQLQGNIFLLFIFKKKNLRFPFLSHFPLLQNKVGRNIKFESSQQKFKFPSDILFMICFSITSLISSPQESILMELSDAFLAKYPF
jgi:hypothetical protein